MGLPHLMTASKVTLSITMSDCRLAMQRSRAQCQCWAGRMALKVIWLGGICTWHMDGHGTKKVTCYSWYTNFHQFPSISLFSAMICWYLLAISRSNPPNLSIIWSENWGKSSHFFGGPLGLLHGQQQLDARCPWHGLWHGEASDVSTQIQLWHVPPRPIGYDDKVHGVYHWTYIWHTPSANQWLGRMKSLFEDSWIFCSFKCGHSICLSSCPFHNNWRDCHHTAPQALIAEIRLISSVRTTTWSHTDFLRWGVMVKRPGLE